ncbi:MAG: hypothetical protein Q8S73_31100 [Deltaproteobacteria bacterium]|nr:hypothetical protein [Deltaproteobacteria bacterium]
MRPWCLFVALACAGCRGGCRRPPPVEADADVPGDALGPRRDAPAVRTACRVAGRQGIPSRDVASDAGLEALVAAPGDGGVSVFWSLSGAHALGRWRTGQRAVGAVEAGAGERSDPVLAVNAQGALAAAWIGSRLGAREHVVWTGDGPAGRCVGAEGRDEGLSLALAGLGPSWLVAWDEEGPAPAAGSVRGQVVSIGPAGLLCGAQRTLSPAAHDAADPLAVALPGGRAAVFWLTARDIDATESNDTATDVWGVLVGPTGAPVGAPLRVTRTVDHHFGLGAFAAADAVWISLRGGGPSDSEGRGDGGEVRAVRVDLGPAGLLRAGDLAVVSDDGANPTGAPRVTRALAPGAAAEVWWRERHGERVEVRHRSLDASGRPMGAALPAWVEPSMAGALPGWVDERSQAWVARVGAAGAELVRFVCPAPGR